MNSVRCYFCFIVSLCLAIIDGTGSARAEWTAIRINNNKLSLDAIWGSSDNDIYAISFTGKVFHKNESQWSDISSDLFKLPQFPEMADTSTADENDTDPDVYIIPYGVFGTSSTSVFIVGSILNRAVDDYLTKGSPFILYYNGSIWSRILIADQGSYAHNWLAGIWGTSPSDMYFGGGRFTGGEEEGEDSITGGVIIHVNALTGEWTGELDLDDLLNANYTDALKNPMPMINAMTGVGGHLYAVGLKGLILHKDLSGGSWEIMPTESLALNFFRMWGTSDDSNNKDLFAVGFNSSSYAGVIYRYNEKKENAWIAMSVPELRTGYISALWGIWGESSENVHSVGNTGVTLYYDGNDGDIWKQMMSDTTTSLNSVWGTVFDNAYASGEDGKIYRFNGIVKTSSIGAYPKFSVAPQRVEFSDLSSGEVDRWEWNFGEGDLPAKAPTADLDYKILVTSVTDTSMNGARIVVVDETSGNTGTSLKTVEPVSAQADLGQLIHITAKPGYKANAYSIHVIKSDFNGPASIYRYQYGIYLKINETTTLGDMADLILTLSDVVLSAVPDEAEATWASLNPSSSSVKFTGGQNYTIYVHIDSGITTQQEIANILVTHDKIDTAVADTPTSPWTRGNETVSNIATFSGGLENGNVYVNTDTTLENYYMAEHTYETPGSFKARLTLHRPDVPAVAEILVRQSDGPEALTYNQAIAIATTPGTEMNGGYVTILDGGDGCTPSISWLGKNITVTVDSGTTTQQTVVNMLLTHPRIIGANPSKYDDPWYSNKTTGSDSGRFFNGVKGGTEMAETDITVFDENPLDFTVSPSSGVKNVTAVFNETAGDEIKNRIVKWMWYFNYVSYYEPGSVDDGSILSLYSADDPVTFTYNSQGTYNVKLVVLLDDNSPFTVLKQKAITVKSNDEGKNSFEGGSGLDNLSGCFIGSLRS